MRCSFVLPMGPVDLNRFIYIYVSKRNLFSRRKYSFSHMYSPARDTSRRGIPCRGMRLSGMLSEGLAEARCMLKDTLIKSAKLRG